MAPGESQDLSWAAKGWEVMSFFVFVLYSSKAAVKIASKLVGAVEVDGNSDMVLVEDENWMLWEMTGWLHARALSYHWGRGTEDRLRVLSRNVRKQGAVIFVSR